MPLQFIQNRLLNVTHIVLPAMTPKSSQCRSRVSFTACFGTSFALIIYTRHIQCAAGLHADRCTICQAATSRLHATTLMASTSWSTRTSFSCWCPMRAIWRSSRSSWLSDAGDVQLDAPAMHSHEGLSMSQRLCRCYLQLSPDFQCLSFPRHALFCHIQLMHAVTNMNDDC